MPDLTRRRALLAIASGTAALAGCAGDDGDPTVGRPHANRAVEEYEARAVRAADETALFTQDDELPTDPDGERGRYARGGRHVVVSEETLAELTFGDGPEAEQLRSFATATDFDAASLYLLAMPVEACYEIRLQSVTVEWDELGAGDLHPHADFCRAYRPADVDCRTDETHLVGFAIRLPVAAKDSSGSGRGMSSRCGPNPEGEYFEATVTPADGGDDE
ncbi:hypothetical protein [Halosimplex pelagicum]|uniref:Uncharacterized protein n=1 Tax=Halosimplex pelagicum TaxID=869886 RepID=A0A7D5TEE6_9EURY|nr:hypothetical protein [Halosimplex pelagicum]QLH84653.1 hypothetical protein HZS54_24745 [Halosimplex pelagicum]